MSRAGRFLPGRGFEGTARVVRLIARPVVGTAPCEQERDEDEGSGADHVGVTAAARQRLRLGATVRA